MICKDCKSKSIKTRTNHSHGKKSKTITSAVCKKCGSTRIEDDKPDYKRRQRR